MSEVNYRRNGMKYSTTGRCWGMAPKAGGFASDLPEKGPKPKSSRERRAVKKGKLTGETPVGPVEGNCDIIHALTKFKKY